MQKVAAWMAMFVVLTMSQHPELGAVESSRQLLLAASSGDANLVGKLISAGADVNARAPGGVTPLHLAARRGHARAIQVLVVHGADLRAQDWKGHTPLYRMPWSVYTSAIRALVGKGPDHPGNRGLNPLHRAAGEGDVQAIERLVGAGADLEAKDARSMSPLHWAAAQGQAQALVALLSAGANVKARDEDGRSALHYAAMMGHGEATAVLLGAGAHTNARDSGGSLPIHGSIWDREGESCKALIKAGADVNERDGNGLTALHWVARLDAPYSVETLIANGADVNACSGDGITPLHVAALRGEDPQVAKLLISNGADVERTSNRTRWTPLLFACAARNPAVLKLLLAAGANAQIKTSDGEDSVYLATHKGLLEPWFSPTRGQKAYREVLDLLEKAGVKVTVHRPGRRTPLQEAISAGDRELVRRLLKKGADINDVGEGGMTALAWAAWHGDTETVKMLLAAGADVKSPGSGTAIHRAAAKRDLESVKALIEAGADLSARTSQGFTVLHSVARRGDVNILKTILATGADPNMPDRRGNTPLHEAGSAEAVKALVEAGGDVHATGRTDRTPLHNMVERGTVGAVKTLLKAGANLEARDARGATPLIVACRSIASYRRKGQDSANSIVEALLTAGADVDAKDREGRSAKDWARERGNSQILALLRSYGTGESGTKPDPQEVSKELNEYRALATQSVNRFGLDLYAQLDRGDKNLVFSPLSAYSPLAMAYAGASGKTAEEMAHVLEIGRTRGSIHKTLGGLMRRLKSVVMEDGGRLEVANGIWARQHEEYRIRKEYRETTEMNYGVTLQEVDFLKAPRSIVQDINAWVEQKTNGRIRDVVSMKDVLPDPAQETDPGLILLNAVYFKCLWARPFKAGNSRKEDFTLLNGSKTPAWMMNHTSKDYPYMEDEGFQVLEMPYKGCGVSMVVFLPTKPDGLAAFEKGLTPRKLAGWLERLSRQVAGVKVTFPSFVMESQLKLVPPLKAIGLKAAFDRRTSLSDGFAGMVEKRKPGGSDFPMFISDVLQKAWIDVTEEGSEAAAATRTSVVYSMGTRREKPKLFRADHPFFFIICDRMTNCILFMGRVTKPDRP